MRRSWGRQKPPLGSQINWGHPLAQGMDAAYLLNEGAGTRVVNQAGTIAGTLSFSAWKPTENGLTLYMDQATGSYIDTNVLGYGSNTLFAESAQKWTVVSWACIISGSTGTVIGKAASTNRTFQIFHNGGSVSPGIIIRNSTTNTNWGITDSKWHQVVVVWDGMAATAYLDGGAAKTIATVSTAAENTSDRIIIGARTNGTAFGIVNGYVGNHLIYRTNLSSDQVAWLYAEPYAFIAPPQPWRAYSIPSGNVYDESISLGVSAGITTARSATVEASITLTASHGIASGRTADLAASVQMDLLAGLTVSRDAILAAGVSLGAQLGVTMARAVELDGSITLPAGLGLLSAAELIAENAAAFGVSLDLAAGLGSIFSENIALGMVAAMAATGQTDFQPAIALGIQAGMLPAASAEMQAAFTLGLSAGISATANAELNAAIALLASLGITTAGATADQIITSILRTYKVMAESRTLRVAGETRVFDVPGESRTFKVN